MSEEKFTKGPWQVFDIHSEHVCLTVAPKQEVKDYSGIKVVHNDVCTVYSNNELGQANANLIAAAPDMYTALRTIVEVIERKTEFSLDELDPVYLKTLLAKARGE